ncbi:MAG: hypothetical protein R2815_09355 [Flavobacteriales bacterium]
MIRQKMVPARADACSRSASINKLYTAVAVAKLVGMVACRWTGRWPTCANWWAGCMNTERITFAHARAAPERHTNY